MVTLAPAASDTPVPITSIKGLFVGGDAVVTPVIFESVPLDRSSSTSEIGPSIGPPLLLVIVTVWKTCRVGRSKPEKPPRVRVPDAVTSGGEPATATSRENSEVPLAGSFAVAVMD